MGARTGMRARIRRGPARRRGSSCMGASVAPSASWPPAGRGVPARLFYGRNRRCWTKLPDRCRWRSSTAKRRQAQLRHADRLATIGKLAAGVAHELNEPLGAILGFAQLLAKTPRLPARAAGDLHKIERAALHAREIIRGLLAFSRQSAPRLEPVDLNALIEDGLDRWALRCEDGSVTLTLDLERPLPPVAGDAAQLRQVLTNLVLNAIQAMPGGGVVRLETRRVGDGVELTVADTGQGIAPEDLPRIFDPFFTTKDVDQGSGLGLSVTHGIVTAHGGALHVDSALQKGTRVTVRLPLQAAPPSRGGTP